MGSKVWSSLCHKCAKQQTWRTPDMITNTRIRQSTHTHSQICAHCSYNMLRRLWWRHNTVIERRHCTQVLLHQHDNVTQCYNTVWLKTYLEMQQMQIFASTQHTLHKIYKAYRYTRTYYSKSVTFTERKAPLESNVPMSSSFSAILHSGNSVKIILITYVSNGFRKCNDTLKRLTDTTVL